MDSSLVITSKSFIYSYLKVIKNLNIKHVHPKKITNDILQGKYHVVFVDFSLGIKISKHNINMLRLNTKVMISLTPSNDELIFRTFPFYLFNKNHTYPLSLNELAKYSYVDDFRYTREIIENAKLKEFSVIRSKMNTPPDNEELLICYYQALIENNEFSAAEEIKNQFYTTYKIPVHPRLKIISSIDSIEDINIMISYVQMEIEYYCNTIEDQLFLKKLNIEVNNEYKNPINELYASVASDLYKLKENLEYTCDKIKEFIEIDKSFVFGFLIFRKFELFPAMDNITKMFVILFAINISDINVLKVIKFKDITFSPIINIMIRKLINNKINQIKPLERYSYDFDYVTCHMQFLQNHRKINYNYSRRMIYNSVYILIVNRGGFYESGIKKLSYYFKDNEILNIFHMAISLYNRRSFIKKSVD